MAIGERKPSLEPREVEVLVLVAQGLPDKLIARRCSLSPRTVGAMVSTILGKLRATNRAHAVALAIQQGIISVECSKYN